jgi:hypothetical protein
MFIPSGFYWTGYMAKTAAMPDATAMPVISETKNDKHPSDCSMLYTPFCVVDVTLYDDAESQNLQNHRGCTPDLYRAKTGFMPDKAEDYVLMYRCPESWRTVATLETGRVFPPVFRGQVRYYTRL